MSIFKKAFKRASVLVPGKSNSDKDKDKDKKKDKGSKNVAIIVED